MAKTTMETITTDITVVKKENGESVYQQWKHIHSKTELFDFSTKCVKTKTSGYGNAVCFGSLDMAAVIIGAINIESCPIKYYIPIYLIVSGVVGIVITILAVWAQFMPKKKSVEEKPGCIVCLIFVQILCCGFSVIWLILGHVWVFGTYAEVDYKDTNSTKYCDKTTYIYAFIVTVIPDIILAVMLSCCICCSCCILCFATEGDDDEEKLKVQPPADTAVVLVDLQEEKKCKCDTRATKVNDGKKPETVNANGDMQSAKKIDECEMVSAKSFE